MLSLLNFKKCPYTKGLSDVPNITNLLATMYAQTVIHPALQWSIILVIYVPIK